MTTDLDMALGLGPKRRVIVLTFTTDEPMSGEAAYELAERIVAEQIVEPGVTYQGCRTYPAKVHR